MTPDIFITGISLWAIVKTLALILLGMYLIFALVVVKQVKLMTDTLTLGHESLVKSLAFAHLTFAVFVFVVAVIVL